MASPGLPLALDLGAFLAWALAIAVGQWLLFGIGLFLFVASVVTNDPRGLLQWFNSTRLATGVAAIVVTVLMAGLLSLAGLAAPGTGRGLTLQVGGLLVTLVILMAVATGVAIVWITAWRAMGREPPEWAVYAFATALSVFAIGFLLIPWAVSAEGPDAYEIRSKLQMALMAAGAVGAAAVPPLVRRNAGPSAGEAPPAMADYR